jgi:hypothetical protein
MGLLGRMTGWDQQKDAHNAVLANHLVETANDDLKRLIADRLVSIQERALKHISGDRDAILYALSNECRIVQMNFVAMACNTLNISPNLPGMSFTLITNPYLSEDKSSINRIEISMEDISARCRQKLSWPGNNVKVDFSSWGKLCELNDEILENKFVDIMLGNIKLSPTSNMNLDIATEFAYSILLMKIVAKSDVNTIVLRFSGISDLVSEYELAAISALSFFIDPNLFEYLESAQMLARLTVAEWAEEEKIHVDTLRNFENNLYLIYK